MGMGAAPLHGWVISDEDLARIVSDEFKALEDLLRKSESDWDALAFDYAMAEPVIKDIDHAYDNLVEAFQKATTVEGGHGERCRLTLDLQFYDAEIGDRYDELKHGHYWDVTGMKMLTPAGLKFKDVVEQKSWTQFG